MEVGRFNFNLLSYVTYGGRGHYRPVGETFNNAFANCPYGLKESVPDLPQGKTHIKRAGVLVGNFEEPPWGTKTLLCALNFFLPSF